MKAPRLPYVAAVAFVAFLSLLPLMYRLSGARTAKVSIDSPGVHVDVEAAKICIDKPVGTPSGAASLAALKGSRWSPGQMLRVRFLEGSPRQRRLTMAAFRQWSSVCNVKFTEVRSGPAEIRVSFQYGYGSWSLIGRGSMLADQSKASLNLGWHNERTPDAEWYVATHECGHALGFAHEHQSPNARIPWDVPKVLRYFRGYPNYWTDAMTYANVLQRMTSEEVDAGPYDRLSIMQYPVDSALTVNGFAVGVNDKISAGDAARARVWYPFPGDRTAEAEPVFCPLPGAWTVPDWRRAELAADSAG